LIALGSKRKEKEKWLREEEVREEER